MLYQLTNKNGITVDLLDTGATIVSLIVPDRQGKPDDICLGFADLQEYKTNSFYFGCTVGRYANRIRNGRFALDGKNYQLTINDGPNCLHGGSLGFSRHIWKAAKSAATYGPTVSFSRLSPDGEEGFPANMDVTVSYTLSDKNELIICYEARSDAPTIVNLTNHAYFNLAGNKSNRNVFQHELKIYADCYTPSDSTQIPTGQLAEVAGTPLDFRSWQKIGARLQEIDSRPKGYDHNFVLRKAAGKPACDLAAEVYEPDSGRCLQVYTDQPGVQFYSGNFLDGSLKGKNSSVYSQYSGFCLETQNYPDSCNQPAFPSPVLRPGEIYKTTTIYKFSTEKTN